jgi:thioredoxin-dependent peroxiredoxin
MIAVGNTAPDFVLQGSNGENVSLSDFRGKNVVLYFYPKDMTPGCTTEACEFRDFHSAYEEANTVIIGVSPDPLEKHKKFIEKHGLPFLLLVDDKQEVANDYRAWKLKKNFGKEYMGIERSTFLINKEGILVYEWRKVRVKDHVAAVLRYIEENIEK